VEHAFPGRSLTHPRDRQFVSYPSDGRPIHRIDSSLQAFVLRVVPCGLLKPPSYKRAFERCGRVCSLTAALFPRGESVLFAATRSGRREKWSPEEASSGCSLRNFLRSPSRDSD
jgi:hypothetical protein